MATTPLTDRLERFFSADFHLRESTGKGVNSHVDLCAMQAVDWLAGSPGDNLSDMPDCACPAIRRYVIRLNDSWTFRNHRDDLKPFLPRIVGTRASRDITVRRGLIAADYAIRVFVPIRLRSLGREEWAKDMESLPPVNDHTSATTARDAALKIRKAAAAYAAAYADADAAAAADAAAYADADAAADAAAYAYADADAAAAAYAYADADAAAAAAALRPKSLECLDAMIAAY